MDQTARKQLTELLHGGLAHMTFDDAIADFPQEYINTKPPNVSYTPWHLLEHIRITQWDILEFVRNPQHVSPSWPEGHWPAPAEQATPTKWNATITSFRADLRDFEKMAQDPNTDFFGQIPHAPGYTIFRELMLAADHNAYHIGEFGILRQVMGTWPKK